MAQMLADQAEDLELLDLGRKFIVKSDRHGNTYHWTRRGLPILHLPHDILPGTTSSSCPSIPAAILAATRL